MNIHKLTLVLLYAVTFAVAAYLVVEGWEYYGLTRAERAHHEQHETWKPSGLIGHGVGIIGSALMMILLLYSLRKRWRPMQDWGNIRYWLNYHIWMGITGPILVLFHTTFKFGGIVSVSFWSMAAVALSGFLGRYIYVQIPRSVSGNELSSSELTELEEELQVQLAVETEGNERVMNLIRDFQDQQDLELARRRGFFGWLSDSLFERFRFGELKSRLRATGAIRTDHIHRVVHIARKRAKLHRRIATLNTARKLLHHWHVFHKPFAIIMIIIMIVHITVTVAFGYRWIF